MAHTTSPYTYTRSTQHTHSTHNAQHTTPARTQTARTRGGGRPSLGVGGARVTRNPTHTARSAQVQSRPGSGLRAGLLPAAQPAPKGEPPASQPLPMLLLPILYIYIWCVAYTREVGRGVVYTVYCRAMYTYTTGGAAGLCARAYARVLVPPNLYIHTYIRIRLILCPRP